MIDVMLPFAYIYFGVGVLVIIVFLLLGVLQRVGVRSVFAAQPILYTQPAESDDDDIYVVPQSHETRLHLAEANQGAEDDTFRS